MQYYLLYGFFMFKIRFSGECVYWKEINIFCSNIKDNVTASKYDTGFQEKYNKQ